MDIELFINDLYKGLMVEFENGNICDYDELAELIEVACILGDDKDLKRIRNALVISTIG